MITLVEAPCAANEVDVLSGLANLDIEVRGPFGALVRAEAIRIRCGFDVAHRRIEGLGVLHGLHHRITTQVRELGDMFDVERADINAGIASGAGPNCLLCDTLHHRLLGLLSCQQQRRVFVGVVANVVDDFHRIESLARGVGRADILTACTRGARPAVYQLPPGVLCVSANSEGIDVQVLQRNRLAIVADREWSHLARRLDIVEEDVWHGHHQMHVLGEWNQHEEHADREHVDPISGYNGPVGNAHARDPVSNWLPSTGRAVKGFDHERCDRDGEN